MNELDKYMTHMVEFMSTESISMLLTATIFAGINFLFAFFKTSKEKVNEFVEIVLRKDDKEIKIESLKKDIDNEETKELINSTIIKLNELTGTTSSIEIIFEDKKSKRKNNNAQQSIKRP